MNKIIGEGMRILGVFAKNREAVTVVTVQTVLGTDPEKAGAVLKETIDGVLR